jgi:methionine transaminase
MKSKLPNSGTTIFSTMSALAQQHGAINLSQGFPDFDMPASLVSGTSAAMASGKNQYAPMPGLLSLRAALAEKLEQSYHHYYDPETEITITSGATQAIYTTIAALVHAGDEVIVLEPCYDSYIPSIQMAGGIAITVRMEAPEYPIPWDEVQSKIGSRTRMIIVNSPHNPTGSVLRKSDLAILSELVSKHGIFILSDEVYEHLIFDKGQHESICRYKQLYNNAIAVFSFGKTFHCTGWKLGYVVAAAAIMKEIRKVHQFMVFSSFAPAQYGLVDLLADEKYFQGLANFFEAKRNYFLRLMESSNFIPLPCHGSYFQLLSYPRVSNLRDREFCEALTLQYGVATIPVSAFYSDGFDQRIIRVCFAKQDATLAAAATKLRAVVKI